jgi:Osmosensitive K+ channel histidine kinase
MADTRFTRDVSTEYELAERLKRLEFELADAQTMIADLRDRDALKTQFLSNISHDLRTPLTAIITHAEILRDGILGEVGPKQKDSISVIITGGRQLLDMIAEILTHARHSSGPLTLVESVFSIEDVVKQVTALNESLVAKKGLTLSLSVKGNIPMVRGDRDKVIHVLTNLLGNAFEFTPSGGKVWVNVEYDPKKYDKMVLLEVATRDEESHQTTTSSSFASSLRSIRRPPARITARDLD